MLYTVENTIEVGMPVYVYVNGNQVLNAISADTDNGVVVYAPEPVRVKKNSDVVYTRKLRGKVTVVPVG